MKGLSKLQIKQINHTKISEILLIIDSNISSPINDATLLLEQVNTITFLFNGLSNDSLQISHSVSFKQEC